MAGPGYRIKQSANDDDKSLDPTFFSNCNQNLFRDLCQHHHLVSKHTALALPAELRGVANLRHLLCREPNPRKALLP